MSLFHYNSTRIVPSILAANLAYLGEEVKNVVAAGADWIHFDVMDNHYVPNLTLGPMVCSAIKPYVQVPIDVHLMVRPVDKLIPLFAQAGANIITFHPEASQNICRTLSLISKHGCKSGLAFNPETPLTYMNNIMDKLDVVVLMGVQPGFSGQDFIPEVIDKLHATRTRIDDWVKMGGKPILLEVDGGIKIHNIADIRKAGADTFVAGSAIFHQKNYAQTIGLLRKQITCAGNKISSNCS